MELKQFWHKSIDPQILSEYCGYIVADLIC